MAKACGDVSIKWRLSSRNASQSSGNLHLCHLTYKRYLPVGSAVELWVNYSLTPYRSCATVDKEEEEEDEAWKKASALSSQRRTR